MRYRSPNPGLGMLAVVTVAVFAGFWTESLKELQPSLVPEVGEMI